MDHDMSVKRTLGEKEITYTEYLVGMFDYLDRENYTDDEIIPMLKAMYISLNGNEQLWDQEYFKWVATDWVVMKTHTGFSLEELYSMAKELFEGILADHNITKISQLPNIKDIMTGTNL